MQRLVKKTFPFLILLFLGFLYLRTLAPGLTWAYDSADSGDLLTALATGGVPHPGGYPTYLLFASLFSKIPIGSFAFRINLFSALCMLLAIYILFLFVLKFTKSFYVASFSTLIFGTFPLVWSQALITEVYALQTLLAALALLLLVPKNSSSWQDFTGGAILGLALGSHLTAVFLLPFLLIKNATQRKRHLKNLIRRIAGFCMGLSVFFVIPIRAGNQAPVNWGNAVDWEGFWWLISGRMYHGRLGHFSLNYLGAATRLWSQFLLDQMGVLGVTVALIYIVVFFKPTRLHLTTLWLTLTFSIFAIIYYSPDSYVYLILPLLAFAIWIGLGSEYLIENLPEKISSLKPLEVTLLFVAVIARALILLPSMDISADQVAEDFAQSILTEVPHNAILITSGDEPTFSLWYFHYALGQRPDITIISRDLFPQSWYQETLKATYPELNISQKLLTQNLMETNPHHPVCVLGASLEPEFECFFPSNR